MVEACPKIGTDGPGTVARTADSDVHIFSWFVSMHAVIVIDAVIGA